MSIPVSASSLYVSGAARFQDLIYLNARDRGLHEREVAHSRFIGFDQGLFAHMGDRSWSAAGICVAKKPTERMIAVGEDAMWAVNPLMRLFAQSLQPYAASASSTGLRTPAGNKERFSGVVTTSGSSWTWEITRMISETPCGSGEPCTYRA